MVPTLGRSVIEITLDITLRKVEILNAIIPQLHFFIKRNNPDQHHRKKPFYTVISPESHLNQSWSFPIQTCEVLLQFGLNKRFFKTSIKLTDIFWNKHFSTQDALFP